MAMTEISLIRFLSSLGIGQFCDLYSFNQFTLLKKESKVYFVISNVLNPSLFCYSLLVFYYTVGQISCFFICL